MYMLSAGADLNLGCPLDDMVVGHDMVLVVPHNAAARTLFLLQASDSAFICKLNPANSVAIRLRSTAFVSVLTTARNCADLSKLATSAGVCSKYNTLAGGLKQR